MFTEVSRSYSECEVPKNIILNRRMISNSEFFRISHHLFGIGGPTNTVFCLTLNLRINQDGDQTFKNNARHFDMS